MKNTVVRDEKESSGLSCMVKCESLRDVNAIIYPQRPTDTATSVVVVTGCANGLRRYVSQWLRDVHWLNGTYIIDATSLSWPSVCPAVKTSVWLLLTLSCCWFSCHSICCEIAKSNFERWLWKTHLH
jgi:hypothetical protein